MCFSYFLCDFGRPSNNKLKASADALTTCMRTRDAEIMAAGVCEYSHVLPMVFTNKSGQKWNTKCKLGLIVWYFVKKGLSQT
jgi:hypothetical protein